MLSSENLIVELLSKYRGPSPLDTQNLNLINMENFFKKYKIFMKKMMTRQGLKFKKFAAILKECNALHAGGSLTSIMTVEKKEVRELVKEFLFGKELDLYVSIHDDNHMQLLGSLLYMGFKIYQATGTLEYGSVMKQNQIVGRIRMHRQLFLGELPECYTMRIDVMIIHNRNNKYPLDVVQNFDLTCCEIWFDGEKTECSDINVFKTRIAPMRPIYIKEYMNGNKFLQSKVRKYMQMGWRIKIATPDDDYFLTNNNEDRNIDIHELLLSKLFSMSFCYDQFEKISNLTIFPFNDVEELKDYFACGAFDDFLLAEAHSLTTQFLHFVYEAYHPSDFNSAIVIQNLFHQEFPWIIGAAIEFQFKEEMEDWFTEICDDLNISAPTVKTIRDQHEGLKERIVYLFSTLDENSYTDSYNTTITYQQCRDLESFDYIMQEDVNVGNYLDDNDNNFVVIANIDDKYTPFLTSFTGPGSITDLENSKYFVKCMNDDINQRSASVETTEFRVWYQRLLGAFNISVPLKLLVAMTFDYDVRERMLQTRCILVKDPIKSNSSHVVATMFKEGKNIFEKYVDNTSETHCNATEYFMSSMEYVG